MIITRTPFRISFCGGGSDIKTFYEYHEGCVISSSINKYMYISLHPFFEPDKISLKYSQTELADGPDQIRHRIFRETLREYGIKGIEITSTADIPAGTGLGSSSAFTVGLINVLNEYTGQKETRMQMAQHACEIEIDRLAAPIGKQDQYAAAFGGLNMIRFLPNGNTLVEPIRISSETLSLLERRLMMFYTGELHDAGLILSEQNANMKQADRIESVRQMCSLARELRKSLERNDLRNFGAMLHENWLIKKTLAGGISSPLIDEIYAQAMRHGAQGGKLLGAGGGGFLLFYCEEDRQEELKNALGLWQLNFLFEKDGTAVIYQDAVSAKKE